MLAEYLNRPLEREYEGWITDRMELYFRKLGIRADIFAISPLDEKTWPADEVIGYRSKIVGLQFKRPRLADRIPTGPNDFSRLYWTLGNPPNQYDLIRKTPEIYYCLPTFINRKIKRNALYHTLFWKPDSTDGRNTKAWYNYPKADPIKSHPKICDSWRWGYFTEMLLACNIGKILNTTLREYIAGLYKQQKDVTEDNNVIPEDVRRSIMYFILWPIP